MCAPAGRTRKACVAPAFSAKKIQGVRAYEMARRGEPVELKSQLFEVELMNCGVQLVPDAAPRFDVPRFDWHAGREELDCHRLRHALHTRRFAPE